MIIRDTSHAAPHAAPLMHPPCTRHAASMSTPDDWLGGLVVWLGSTGAGEGGVTPTGHNVSPCSPHAPPMQPPSCTSHAALMHPPCSPHAPPMQQSCTHHAARMHPPCSPHAPPMRFHASTVQSSCSPLCSPPCSPLHAPTMHPPCSLREHTG